MSLLCTIANSNCLIGTGDGVGGSGVSVGAAVAVGGKGVAVGGKGVAVGGKGVAVGGAVGGVGTVALGSVATTGDSRVGECQLSIHSPVTVSRPPKAAAPKASHTGFLGLDELFIPTPNRK